MGFAKADGGKADYSLLGVYDFEALDQEVRVLAMGAAKYSRTNWWQADVLEGLQRYTAAMLRHTLAHARGEMRDEESGLLHVAHIRANAGFLVRFIKLAEEAGISIQDDPNT